MRQHLSVIALLGTVSLSAACGSDAASAGDVLETADLLETADVPENAAAANPIEVESVRSEIDPFCTGASRLGACLIHPEGVPFVRDAVVETDGVSTARMENSTRGTVCTSGTLAEVGVQNDNWGSTLSLRLAEWGGTPAQIIEPFDADELGITQIQFTLELRAAQGVAPETISVVVAFNDVSSPAGCAGSSTPCLTSHPLMLADEMGAPELISTTRTIKAPLSAFKDLWGSQTLQTTRMNALMFGVGTRDGASVEYDFCVRGLEFLDADDNEVAPGE